MLGGDGNQQFERDMVDAVLEQWVSEEDRREDEDDVADIFGDFGPDPAEAPAEHEDAPPEEAPSPPNIPLPVCPSQEAWDDHFRTHLNYRSWCPVCVAARGREDPHRSRGDVERPGCPTICFDYKELRKGSRPLIVMKDQRTKATVIHQAQCKGPGDLWLIRRLLRDIDNLGHVKVSLKGDGEPAMQDLMNTLKHERQQPTVIEEPPGNDPQSHGIAEKAVQDTLGHVRTLKLGLEHRIGHPVSDAHPVFEWICEHAGWLITHLRIGTDGLTAWQRITGRSCKQELVEFGELVWAKPLRQSAGKERKKINLEARWFKAVWVGVHVWSTEHVVIREGSGPAVKVRTIKRMTEQERWNYGEIDRIVARPRRPDPRALVHQRREMHEREVAAAEAAVRPASEAAAPQAADGSNLQSGRIVPGEQKVNRDFRITHGMVVDIGATDDCPGCRQSLAPGASRGNHTHECRQRFERELSKTAAGRRRLQSRDARHGLAEPETVEAEAGNEEREEEVLNDGEDRGEGVDEPEGEEQGRRVRPRLEEARGIRRPREDQEEDEDEPPARSRRVGSIDRIVADVIRINTERTAKEGRRPDKRCTREIARQIISDLDRKHARKLKIFENRTKNERYNVKKSSRGIAEAYSPPRMVLVAEEFGLTPQWSLDLTVTDRDDGEPLISTMKINVSKLSPSSTKTNRSCSCLGRRARRSRRSTWDGTMSG